MFVIKIILYFFSILLFLTVFLPMIKKDFWVFRIFDYPKLQKLTIIIILIGLWIVGFRNTNYWIDYTIVILLFLSCVPLIYVIFPFTPLSKTMIDKVVPTNQKIIRFLVFNVYQYNKSYSKLLDLVKKRNPDILLLLETDDKWMHGIEILNKTYTHSITIPKSNTYGLLFYSQFPIEKYEINYLIDPEIPSIIVDIAFEKQTIRLYGLHPTPPVPQENKHSTDRDAEILMIGKLAKKYRGPCIVLGDLNDVAWSYTTTLFLKTSGLLDPRRGRGMFSTFNANYFLLRWPLDHYFVSSHFRLVAMKVEKHIDSDHFPISIQLLLTHKDSSDQLEGDNAHNELVNEKIKAGIENKPL